MRSVCNVPVAIINRVPRRRLSVTSRLLYLASRSVLRQRAARAPTDLKRTTDRSEYRAWRRRELQRQLTEAFDPQYVTGRDVLDFACGSGELSALLAHHQPKSIVGMDMSAVAVANASKSFATPDRSPRCPVRFVRNERHDTLPIPTHSVDLICCLDAVEHIPDVRAVAREWRRVLRPGGRVWVWWSPWRGPYGHHLDSLIPIPWVHLLLRERTIFSACAAQYDDPGFVPRIWDVDPATGRKKPNKWDATTSFHPFLNRLTRRAFESATRRAGLVVRRRRTQGFRGSAVRRMTRVLLPLPIVGECFVSFFAYEFGPA